MTPARRAWCRRRRSSHRHRSPWRRWHTARCRLRGARGPSRCATLRSCSRRAGCSASGGRAAACSTRPSSWQRASAPCPPRSRCRRMRRCARRRSPTTRRSATTSFALLGCPWPPSPTTRRPSDMRSASQNLPKRAVHTLAARAPAACRSTRARCTPSWLSSRSRGLFRCRSSSPTSPRPASTCFAPPQRTTHGRCAICARCASGSRRARCCRASGSSRRMWRPSRSTCRACRQSSRPQAILVRWSRWRRPQPKRVTTTRA
mmetsp:Transcript_63528/g.174414  ORF Transcript_63528/g.174414 Transcript_63528/m.174414 type:complete len:261 (+) Transcript_63528:33-815(+)